MPRWILPLPPSVNDMHGLGMDRRGKVHKYSKAEYSHWLAAIPALIGH